MGTFVFSGLVEARKLLENKAGIPVGPRIQRNGNVPMRPPSPSFVIMTLQGFAECSPGRIIA
jgi:hypothetical protein